MYSHSIQYYADASILFIFGQKCMFKSYFVQTFFLFTRFRRIDDEEKEIGYRLLFQPWKRQRFSQFSFPVIQILGKYTWTDINIDTGSDDGYFTSAFIFLRNLVNSSVLFYLMAFSLIKQRSETPNIVYKKNWCF